MEKRRRARINNCLNELKTLILDATKKDPARHSKLEKADILEKTVKHLQELQRQQLAMQHANDPKIINKFKAGFTECANEVNRFPGIDGTVKRRLLQHLSGCINSVKCDLQLHQRQLTAAQAQQLHAHLLPSPPSSPEQQQQQQQQQIQQQIQQSTQATTTHIKQTVNGFFLPNGQQVVPTKLANGTIALVLPHQQQQQQQQHIQQSTQPTRTASTSSASSHGSSFYERTLTSSPICSIVAYAPPSPANSYDANIDCKSPILQHYQQQQQPATTTTTLTLAQHQQQLVLQQQQQRQQQLYMQQQQQQQQMLLQQQQQEQQPLALVVRKQQQPQIIKVEEEAQLWRPW